jgi:hypothetical protein
MNGFKIFLGLAPSIIQMLKFKGIDVDIEFIKALEIIPNFIAEKQKEYTDKHPDLDINLMVSFHENEVYIIPVGLSIIKDENGEDATAITKQFESFNVSQFLADIKITELIKILKKNPETPIMEAVEKSRV